MEKARPNTAKLNKRTYSCSRINKISNNNLEEGKKCENTIIVKTLRSPFRNKKIKNFESIFPCKKSNNNNKSSMQNNTNIYSMSNYKVSEFSLGPYGPLIVTHVENREKIKNPPRKFKLEEVPINPYNYFKEHIFCNEIRYCWQDQQHPKILRHYSKDKENKKYKKLDSSRYWVL